MSCVFLAFLNALTPNSEVSKIKEKEMKEGGRGYGLLENLGTDPNVIYLKKVDESVEVGHGH